MKKLIFALVAVLLLAISSCGKDLGAAANYENNCSFRFIAGHNCIVCDKGGVSCKWD